MERLIDIDTFIKLARTRGVDFGKGNPYNRIRYYTKMGLLPHMVRKKEGEENIKGHYPESVLDRLDYIEKQKKIGMTNEEILSRLESENKSKQFTTWLKSAKTRTQLIRYASFIMLGLVLLVELGVIKTGALKQDLVPNTIVTSNPEIVEIIENGSAFVPLQRNSIFVRAKKIQTNSKVYVTFRGDYSPAVRYWVSDVVPNAGFYINLDAPTYNDVEFDWWLSQ